MQVAKLGKEVWKEAYHCIESITRTVYALLETVWEQHKPNIMEYWVYFETKLFTWIDKASGMIFLRDIL